MEAKDIVEVLNQHLEKAGADPKVRLILQKRIDSKLVIKAYKTYDYKVWYVNDSYKAVVFEIIQTLRVTNDKESKEAEQIMEAALLAECYDLLQSQYIIQIANGEFKGSDQ